MTAKTKRSLLSEAIRSMADEDPVERARDQDDERRSQGVVSKAVGIHREALVDEIVRLKEELAGRSDDGRQLVSLDPARVRESTPSDRHQLAFSDEAFVRLVDSIEEHGQQVPIIVRPSADVPGDFDIAAGRRRLAACRKLGVQVLARLMPLSDDALLSLQYRENVERKDISTYERAVWLARLADQHELSTRKLANLFQLSQTSVVEYLKLGRLSEEITELLTDPREITIDHSRKLHTFLNDRHGNEKVLLGGLKEASGQPTAIQIARALQASVDRPHGLSVKKRHITDSTGRRLATLTFSGNQWILRWASGLDDDAVNHMIDGIPQLFEGWQQIKRGRSKTGD